MRSKFKWIFTLLVAFTMQFSFAQQKTVTGVVSDELGPIAGANVVNKATKAGTTTDFDGNYSISAKQGDVLEVSYAGSTQNVTVGAGNTYNVAIKAVVLEETILVGYGTTTKEAFTGTATTLKKENVEAKTVSNISQALRGEVAGVNVITGSGAPGSDATIRIRGYGSINGNRDPLYVVDGAPFSSDISAINPADIETMTVLKDAAATSIYGSRGANGVILITTKQGKSGKTNISVDFKTSINTLMLPNYNVIDSPEEYIEVAWSSMRTKAFVNGLANPEQWASDNLYGVQTPGSEWIDDRYNIWNVSGNQIIDPSTGKVASGVSRRFSPTKWSDAAFGTGYRSEANVQFSGASEKTKYATSFGYLDDQGYVVNSNYRRYTARVNLEHKPKEWLTVGGNMAYTGAKYQNSSSNEGDSGSSGNIFALVNTTPSIYDVYLRDYDGTLVADPIFGGSQYDYGVDRRAWNATNGIADANYDLSQNLSTTLLGNFNFGVDITKDLKFEARYSGQYQNNEGASRNNPYYGGWATAYGSLFRNSINVTNQNFLQLLRYNKSFEDHNIEVFAAHESTDFKRTLFSAGAQRAILPNTLDLTQYTTPIGRADSYTQRWALESYFAQLNYDYLRKYYLTASVRRDGSSKFINNKWGTFGSVGLSWIVSKENFMDKLKFVDFLKLKSSYGIIADQGLNTRYQYGWQLYDINQTPDGSYSFTRSATLANPDLTWEKSNILQFGMESSFFNNRLDVNIDYYVKNTNNLFFDQALPPSSGFTKVEINDGAVRNSGIEFDVTGHLLKRTNSRNYSLSIGVNGEMFKNEITEMPKNPFTGEVRIFDDALDLSVGKSQYDWFMREWAGVDPATGAGLWNMYFDDVNGDGVFNTGDAQITNMVLYLNQNPNAKVNRTTTNVYSNATEKYVGKSAVPKLRGAFRLNATYGNLDFTAQFGYSLGGYIYDNGYAQLMDNGDLIGANNWHRDIHNAWQQPGDITDVPRLTSGLASDVNYNSRSTRFLTKSDYLSLNNVRIGYNLSGNVLSALNLSKFNLYVSGDNLMMLSARNGLNPSTLISSSNSGIYTPMTTFSLGTKIEF